MTNSSATMTTTQVYRTYIKAAPSTVWDAITKPEFTAQYGYGGDADYDLKPGGRFQVRANEGMKAFGAPDIIIDGEVVEADPPRKLVQTWRMLMEQDLADEGFSRLTYDLEETSPGVTRLTVTHDLTGKPTLAMLVSGGAEDKGAGGGWSFVLAALKSLLETGKPFLHGAPQE